MFRSILLISLLAMICLMSCEQDQSGNRQEKAIKEIATDGKITNADIVRLPVSDNEQIDPSEVAVITFEEEVFNFGEVGEGDIIEHTFRFSNSGKAPLLISNAKSTCGCTVPTWPKNAIAPGEEGEITVRFDTENKGGRQSKPISITANSLPAQTKIYLNGFVIEDKDNS